MVKGNPEDIANALRTARVPADASEADAQRRRERDRAARRGVAWIVCDMYGVDPATVGGNDLRVRLAARDFRTLTAILGLDPAVKP